MFLEQAGVCSKQSYNTYVSRCKMIEKLFAGEHPMIHGCIVKHPCMDVMI